MLPQPLPVECVDHGYRAEVTVGNLLAGQGMLCCSLQSSRSLGEIELGRWILDRHPDTVFNHRGLVGPMELDVYVPSLRVAVEYNGDYWHSDAFIRSKLGVTATQRHQQKLQASRQSHVDLLYVWETDWHHRRAEVEQALEDYLTWIEDGCTGDPPPTQKLLKKLTNG